MKKLLWSIILLPILFFTTVHLVTAENRQKLLDLATLPADYIAECDSLQKKGKSLDQSIVYKNEQSSFSNPALVQEGILFLESYPSALPNSAKVVQFFLENQASWKFRLDPAGIYLDVTLASANCRPLDFFLVAKALLNTNKVRPFLKKDRERLLSQIRRFALDPNSDLGLLDSLVRVETLRLYLLQIGYKENSSQLKVVDDLLAQLGVHRERFSSRYPTPRTYFSFLEELVSFPRGFIEDLESLVRLDEERKRLLLALKL